MLAEFKKFAMRGNVLDMAVGIVVGAAFGAIVKSLVDDLLMPPIGLAVGSVDFAALKIRLNEEASINYGLFLNAVVSFLFIAFAVFLLVRGVNRLKAREEAKPAGPTKDQELLTEIRDLLKAKE